MYIYIYTYIYIYIYIYMHACMYIRFADDPLHCGLVVRKLPGFKLAA